MQIGHKGRKNSYTRRGNDGCLIRLWAVLISAPTGNNKMIGTISMNLTDNPRITTKLLYEDFFALAD